MGIVLAWMFQKAEAVMNRFGYIRVKEPLPKGAKLLKFTDRDLIAGTVLNVLRRGMTSTSPASEELIADVANQVVAEISGLPDLSISEQVKRYNPDILGRRHVDYILACGIAAYWELSVKNLAEKLRVSVFEEITSAKKKSPGLRYLEPIIADLKKAAPKLDAWIMKRKKLRDALIHANFHQLKTLALEGKPRSARARMQGAVWQLRLGDGSIRRMSEVQDTEEIKRAGISAWFLEIASSEVLELTVIELKEAIDDFQKLIMFHAMCFDERKGLFEKMFVRGERLTADEVALFYREESIGDVTKLFERLNRMMKK